MREEPWPVMGRGGGSSRPRTSAIPGGGSVRRWWWWCSSECSAPLSGSGASPVAEPADGSAGPRATPWPSRPVCSRSPVTSSPWPTPDSPTGVRPSVPAELFSPGVFEQLPSSFQPETVLRRGRRLLTAGRGVLRDHGPGGRRQRSRTTRSAHVSARRPHHGDAAFPFWSTCPPTAPGGSSGSGPGHVGRSVTV